MKLRMSLLVVLAMVGSVTMSANVAPAATVPMQGKPAFETELDLDSKVEPAAHRSNHKMKPAKRARSGQRARSRQQARSAQRVRSTKTVRSTQRVRSSQRVRTTQKSRTRQHVRTTQRVRSNQRAVRWDRRHHGPRYRHKRYGYNHYHGGYWYRSPWWTAVVVAPVVTVYGGGGNAHVEWCLSNYRSYNPQTDQFLGYDGFYHYCNSPYR